MPTKLEVLWEAVWAEHERHRTLLAMLPCWELFGMGGAELADALANAEMIGAEMVESSNRSLALLGQIAELEHHHGS